MSTKKAAAPAGAPKLTPCDFVYAGKRRITGGKLAVKIYPLLEYGSKVGEVPKLGEPGLYFCKRRSERFIGGVYTGAEFDFKGGQIKGLETARYKAEVTKLMPSAVAEWEAMDELAKEEEKLARLEADGKKMGVIDKAIRPLAQLYDEMRERGDHLGCDALASAVLRSLRSGVRS